MYRRLLALLLALAIILWQMPEVLAQTSTDAPIVTESEIPTPPTEPLNLTVSPITINIETEPGKPIDASIKVFNNGFSPEYLQLELAQFKADETGERPVISAFDPSAEEKNWVIFPEQRFVAQPGVWKTVDLTFSPPESASLGYYFAVVVKRQVDTPNQGGDTVVSAAPAVLLVANVASPNAKRELQLVDVRSTRRMYEFLPVEFEITVKNTGNVHVAPLGNIFIEHGQDKDVGLVSINQGKGLILPGSERVFKVRWEDGFPVYKPSVVDGVEVKNDQGDPVFKLAFDWSQVTKFRFGRFVGTILLVYDDGQRDIPLEAVVSFWVIPWRIILVFGVLGLIMVSGLILPFFLMFKKMKRKR